ncbi:MULTISPECIES: NUDIX domain-containing protein [Brucella/Ochrobactrum group]|uniref:NUDIX domain-containing protein n=1 Tax=Brucella pseudintermedia TaxID=370111 RepID=A0ABY5UD37_9HYPH|nr:MULTISPECIES: NUDIX domain-containing protein [Brucella/Ochrobactrum group]KAB2685414.1 NUDIX domain-containing protein [Brucella pseudintermedia]NKE76720.1 NUDIX domain-containing protein [Ochrobactrum sp. MC-1LL]TWH03981.1 ADP-ribose pyrophosphatase YjhB (NUDIX family) [Ochrobactrum sp. J50]UWL61223.1 NUDIX domain-containing protein [Brucella pseudintermedia]WPM79420.1 NUDIX domain-containing protein [Brucella pseudintermedia]
MRFRHFIFHTYFLLRRPMTLGVRAIVFDEKANSVFLVRHTYVPGWQLPGGGVERGETFMETLEKELREECNIVLKGSPRLFALYKNAHASPRDHVALYVCRQFEQTEPRLPDREIAECGFFPLDNLPEGTTPSTKRRLQEALHDLEPLPVW